MTVEEIGALDVASLADKNCHLWLWTTNAFLPDGFDLMEKWGFKYMIPVHWIKPSGLGAWWSHRSQTMLFGYRGKLEMLNKFKPNVLFAPSRRHSQKPDGSYTLIEEVSHGPRVELFARSVRDGWTARGDEIDGEDLAINLKNDSVDGVQESEMTQNQE